MTTPRSRYGGQTGHQGRTMAASGQMDLYKPNLLASGWKWRDQDLTYITDGDKDTQDEEESKVLEVLDVSLQQEENAAAHYTNQYEVTEARLEEGSDIPAQLVVRRGQPFTLRLKLNRAYDPDTDTLKVVMEIGPAPKISKGTQQVLDASMGVLPRTWSSGIQAGEEDRTAVLTIQAHPDAIVGRWRLYIDTYRKDSEDQQITRYKYPQSLYLLFNPWCKDDQVYMADEVSRDECVLNETGRLFTGNHKQIGSKPWDFGQFEDFMLDCCLYLLDKANIAVRLRNNPVYIARAISAVANAPDDGGVLVGNWSGDYEGGTAPTAWISSVSILEQYWKTRQPVSYGQCWVFSGIVTSICRCLGIPCRSVTNFASAHDCDGSITIDKHWQKDGTAIKEYNEDSVWNFHVWNEVWMARPDLPGPLYGGWQAIDTTPQETSEGIYQAGPCSVEAIKRGDVNLPYDGTFIFAEVNADKVHWILQPNNEWNTVTQKHKIGKCISTHRPRNEARPKPPKVPTHSHMYRNPPAKVDPNRMDITDNYKHKEGSEEERAAVYRANQCSSKPGFYKPGEEDVEFTLVEKDEILVGSNFEIVLKLQNRSRESRHIHGRVTVGTVFYTGVPHKDVKAQEFDMELAPIKGGEAVMRLKAEDYQHLICDQVGFKIGVLATVLETGQTFAEDDDFRLRRPDITVIAPESLSVGSKTQVILRFQNPMPQGLTKCEWQLEGVGIQRNQRIPHKDVEPNDVVEVTVDITPKKTGKRTLVASFSSAELQDVTGSAEITIS